MKLKIVTINDDKNNCLLTKSDSVLKEELESILKLTNSMIAIMHEKNALGIAAPQVGINKRIFILNKGNTVFINPKIISRSERITSREEGCLSIPNQRFNVKRYKNITVKYMDINGDIIVFKSKRKNISIPIQHEIDHLNGKLINDYK